jgi:GH15 family glucan-1,4-alpha-glucosidase
VGETVLDLLAVYRKSRPVRIGNDAYSQLQLDIYGELMDAVYLSDKYGEPISHDLWQNLVRLLGWVCDHWQQPDEGLWEVRGGRQEFLLSRVMCWVAVDRGLRLAAKRSLPAPVDRWQVVRDEIR